LIHVKGHKKTFIIYNLLIYLFYIFSTEKSDNFRLTTTRRQNHTSEGDAGDWEGRWLIGGKGRLDWERKTEKGWKKSGEEMGEGREWMDKITLNVIN